MSGTVGYSPSFPHSITSFYKKYNINHTVNLGHFSWFYKNHVRLIELLLYLFGYFTLLFIYYVLICYIKMIDQIHIFIESAYQISSMPQNPAMAVLHIKNVIIGYLILNTFFLIQTNQYRFIILTIILNVHFEL